MQTNTLYFVFVDILVPFFLNVSRNLEDNFGYKPYLVSFIPRDHALLQKNTKHIYPKSLAEINTQTVYEDLYTDEQIQNMCSFMQLKHGGDLIYWRKRLMQVSTYLTELIDQRKINLILLWNGEDYIGRSLAAIAKKRNIRCIYLENGYFAGTLQADLKGVNLASSVAKLNFQEIKQLNNKQDHQVAQENALKIECCEIQPLSKKQQGLHFLKRVFNPSYYQRYPELRGSTWFKTKLLQEKRKKIPFDKVTLPGQFAFIPLQVHDDTQILLNSPLFNNPKDFLVHCYLSVRAALGKDYPIVVKEHPEDIYRYSYDEIRQQYPDIIWLRKYDIDEVVKKSTFIMVVNSSVGLQAIKEKKKVLVFGDSIYSKNEICFYIQNKDQTPTKILQALQELSQEMEQDIDTYINFIENDYFFKGSWKNQSIENIECTVKKIHELSQKNFQYGD